MRVKKGKQVSVIDRSVIVDKTIETLSDVPKVREIIKEDEIKTTVEFNTLAEKVAKSSLYIRNTYIDELRATCGGVDRKKRIDKLFPFARIVDNAPSEKLYVDEPNSEAEFDMCKEKAKKMKALGLRYLILEKDATLLDALEQLGVV